MGNTADAKNGVDDKDQQEPYLLPHLAGARKSYDVLHPDESTGRLIPLILRKAEPAFQQLRANLVKNAGGEEKFKSLPTAELDKYWLQENACYLAFHDDYHKYLPFRELTYIRLAELIDGFLGTKSGSRIELGCGSSLCLIIQALGGADELHGVDISTAALDFSERLINDYKVSDKVFLSNISFAIPTDQFLQASGYSRGQFNATFNLGVFEHLSDEQQRTLIANMIALTSPGGVIAIAVPNYGSPLLRYTRFRENRLFPIGTDKEKLRSPWLDEHEADISRLLVETGFASSEIERDGILIGPSPRTPLRIIDGSDPEYVKAGFPRDEKAIEFYENIPNMVPSTQKDKINFWYTWETRIASQEERLHLGWFTVYMAKKK
ncbi:methyltransferase domain-containing protein [Candidatus Woesearchaeota archaeon]|nr:methyltransferase domain-containing protein [Candidatus Woesearchaeota archaeon]